MLTFSTLERTCCRGRIPECGLLGADRATQFWFPVASRAARCRTHGLSAEQRLPLSEDVRLSCATVSNTHSLLGQLIRVCSGLRFVFCFFVFSHVFQSVLRPSCVCGDVGDARFAKMNTGELIYVKVVTCLILYLVFRIE